MDLKSLLYAHEVLPENDRDVERIESKILEHADHPDSCAIIFANMPLSRMPMELKIRLAKTNAIVRDTMLHVMEVPHPVNEQQIYDQCRLLQTFDAKEAMKVFHLPSLLAIVYMHPTVEQAETILSTLISYDEFIAMEAWARSCKNAVITGVMLQLNAARMFELHQKAVFDAFTIHATNPFVAIPFYDHCPSFEHASVFHSMSVGDATEVDLDMVRSLRAYAFRTGDQKTVAKIDAVFWLCKCNAPYDGDYCGDCNLPRPLQDAV